MLLISLLRHRIDGSIHDPFQLPPIFPHFHLLCEVFSLRQCIRDCFSCPVAELAQLIRLAATFETYNADCAAGLDSAFGRTQYLVPFTEGPFYAVKTYPYCLMTSGGPRINANAQMVREDGSVIEGAWLCGEIIGSANIGGHATIGGIGHGMNAVWGLTAAENAVANAGK